MAADETILEEEQEALSDDLQAELEDDMFFGEEDQPGEELTDSEDFLSEEELTDTGADELLEDDVAGDADLEDVLGEADEASSEESLTEDTLEMEEGDLEEALDEELSSEADLETEDLAEIQDDELPPLEEGDLGEIAEASDSEEGDAEMEELPPLAEGELSDSESETPEPEDSARSLPAQREQRDVVGLGGAGRVGRDVRPQRLDQGLGGLPGAALQAGDQARLLEQASLGIEGLGHAVAVEQEGLSRLERHGRLLKLQLGLDPDQRIDGLLEQPHALTRSALREHEGRRTVTPVRPGQPTRVEVEHGDEQRHEHAGRVLGAELLVDAPQDLTGALNMPGRALHQGRRHGHEERRRNPLARHVAEHDAELSLADPKGVVEIAAHLPGGLEHGRDGDRCALAGLGELCRNHAELDLGRDAELGRHGLLERVAVGLGLNQRLDADLDLEHVEGLGHVILGAELEAASLVLDLVEGAQKDDR